MNEVCWKADTGAVFNLRMLISACSLPIVAYRCLWLPMVAYAPRDDQEATSGGPGSGSRMAQLLRLRTLVAPTQLLVQALCNSWEPPVLPHQ